MLNYTSAHTAMETHRLGGFGAGQRCVDHPVLQDWARGSFPANVQSVGGGVEDLDVSDGASLHCRARNVRGRRNGEEAKCWGQGQGRVKSKKRVQSGVKRDDRECGQRGKSDDKGRWKVEDMSGLCRLDG